MDCHETLMARRRKRAKAAAAAKARDKENSPMITDKSLPALPPESTAGQDPADRHDPDSDAAGNTSPRPHHSGKSSRAAAPIPARSPERPSIDAAASNKETLTLPSSTYRKNRNSTILPPSGHASNQNDSPDGFYISVALDPNPSPNGSARTPTEAFADASFRKPKPAADRRPDPAASPHIAFQEKNHQQSANHIAQAMAPSRKLSKNDRDSIKASPDTDESRPPEPPRSKRLPATRTNSSQSSSIDQPNGTSRPRASQDTRPADDDDAPASPEPKLPRSGPAGPIPRKEVPSLTRPRKFP